MTTVTFGDARGNAVSSSSRTAVGAYDSGVCALLGFDAGVTVDFRGRHWLEADA